MDKETQLAWLLKYAQEDAAACGQPAPELPAEASLDEKIAVVVRAMAKYGDTLFLPGDPNYDNQKRNLSIRLFLEASPEVLREKGRAWLERWRATKHDSLWFREWDHLLAQASDAELIHILLSHEQEPTRQRLSPPFAGVLTKAIVTDVLRTGVPV